MLLDVEFLLSIQAYANSIYENIFNPEANKLVGDAMEALKNIGQQQQQQHDKVKFKLAETTESVERKRDFKLQGIVEKFAIALVDPEKSVEQVVMLQVHKIHIVLSLL